MMTLQQAFDIGVAAIIKQGKPATDGRGCRYREGDLKCIVGHLIPDERYEPEFEEKGASTVNANLRLIDVDSETLDYFQTIHDGAYLAGNFLPAFKSRAKEFAEGYGLSLAAVGHLLD